MGQNKRPCSYPGCRRLVSGGKCEYHAKLTRAPVAQKVADPFYKTKGWYRARRHVLKRDWYRCVLCAADVSAKGKAIVDHIQPLKTHPHLALDLNNLRTLCRNCDNKRHAETKSGFKSLPRPAIVRRKAPKDWSF